MRLRDDALHEHDRVDWAVAMMTRIATNVIVAAYARRDVNAMKGWGRWRRRRRSEFFLERDGDE